MTNEIVFCDKNSDKFFKKGICEEFRSVESQVSGKLKKIIGLKSKLG